jgi:hypothetical protein
VIDRERALNLGSEHAIEIAHLARQHRPAALDSSGMDHALNTAKHGRGLSQTRLHGIQITYVHCQIQYFDAVRLEQIQLGLLRIIQRRTTGQYQLGPPGSCKMLRELKTDATQTAGD